MSINLLHTCIGAALDLFQCSLRVYDTMEKLHLKQVTDARSLAISGLVAYTQHYCKADSGLYRAITRSVVGVTIGCGHFLINKYNQRT